MTAPATESVLPKSVPGSTHLPMSQLQAGNETTVIGPIPYELGGFVGEKL